MGEEHRLGIYPEKVVGEPIESDAVESFTNKLLETERQLLQLEIDVTQTPLGLTGVKASRQFTDLEERHRTLVYKLNKFQSAVLKETVDPTGINADDEREFRRRARGGEFDTYLEHLNKLATRVGQRLDSRRNSANTRMGLTISVIAISLSAISIIIK